MRKIKRFLSMILIAAMLTGIIPAGAVGVDTSELRGGNLEDVLVERSENTADLPEVPETIPERPEEDAPTGELTETVTGYCGGEGDGTNLRWTLTTDGTLTIEGSGEMAHGQTWYHLRLYITTIVIKYGVTSIGDEAFANFYYLNNVQIAAGVRTIGANSFVGCTALERVTIPGSVKVIGEYAFSGCLALADVTISPGVEIIESGAFSRCPIVSIAIPEGVTALGSVRETDDASCYGVFDNCENLVSVSLPSTLRVIGDDAFHSCEKLSDISIPNGVMSIGHSAFTFCYGLTSVTVPDSVTFLGDAAFMYCENLTHITLSKNLPAIRRYTFYRCVNLPGITIPGSVTEIGECAFECAYKLKYLELPEGVTTVETHAFYWSAITELVLPASLTYIGYCAFYCTSIQNACYRGTEEQWNAVQIDHGNDVLLNNIRFIGNKDAAVLERIDTGDMVINYRGYAVVHFRLMDFNGMPVPGVRLNYRLFDGTTGTKVTDGNGYISVTLNEISCTEGYNIYFSTDSSRYFLLETDHSFAVYVTPLYYSRSWHGACSLGGEVSLGLGVGGSVGAADFEAYIAKASGSISGNVGMTLTDTYDQNGRTLELTVEMGSELADELSSNVSGSILAADLSLTQTGSSIGRTDNTGFGLKIRNYNPENEEHRLQIGKLLLQTSFLGVRSASAQKLLKWLNDGPADNMGSKSTSLVVGEYAETGAIEAGNVGYTIAGIDSQTVFSHTVSHDLSDSSCARRDISYSIECNTVTGALHDKLGYEGGTNSVNVAVSFEYWETLESISFSSYVFGGKKELLWKTWQTEVMQTATVEGDYARAAAQNDINSALYALAYEQRTMFSADQIASIAETLFYLPVTVEYTTTHKTGVEISIPFGAGVLIGAEVEFAGVFENSVSYNNRTDVRLDGESYITTVSTISRNDIPEADLSDYLDTAFDAVLAALKDMIVSTPGKVVEGVSNAYSTVKGTVSGWTAEVSSWFSGSSSDADGSVESYQSYAILVLPDGSTPDTNAAVAVTLGEPYSIAVYTDDTRTTLVSDEELAASPLTLTLRYNAEMLAAAGVTDAADIRIYHFDSERNLYTCMESEQDKTNMSVTAQIDRCGEYILATDSASPLTSDFETSNRTPDLTITALISDLSGIGSFKFWLDDGAVLVDETTLDQYYDSVTGLFTYPCLGLSGGEHTAYFEAADTIGNANAEPFSFTFTVDAEMPVISNVTVPIETVTNADDFVITAVAADNEQISAVVAKVTVGEKTVSVPMTLTEGVWSAVVTGFEGTVEASVTIIATDYAGNRTESDAYPVSIDLPTASTGCTVTVSEIENGTITVTVQNHEGRAMSGWLICAVYDENGKMIELCSEYIGLKAGETAEFTFTLTCDASLIANAKAYLLDVSNGYRPMT